jgi:aryl-alcohol dehydrogenase-like predicted oxidoreductase
VVSAKENAGIRVLKPWQGVFSGKVSSGNPERAKEILSPLTVQEYAYPDNFERLRRCEILAAQKGLSPAQIAFAWVFTRPLDVFPVTSPSSVKHVYETLEAMRTGLTEHEASWLNLECGAL